MVLIYGALHSQVNICCLCHSEDGNYFLCYRTPSYELFGIEIDKEGFPIASTKKKLFNGKYTDFLKLISLRKITEKYCMFTERRWSCSRFCFSKFRICSSQYKNRNCKNYIKGNVSNQKISFSHSHMPQEICFQLTIQIAIYLKFYLQILRKFYLASGFLI